MISATTMKGIREINEDSIMIANVLNGRMDVEIIHEDVSEKFSYNSVFPDDTSIFIIADGMGGLNSGEKASYLTISQFLEKIEEEFQKNVDLEIALINAIINTSKSVKKNAPINSGSTIVGAMLLPKSLVAFNVGDSKCYVKTGSGIFISKDHSYKNMLNDLDVSESVDNNIVTDYIGMDSDPDVRIYSFEHRYPLILCSDGLDILTKNGIDSSLFNRCAEELCNAAINAGSEDNVSVIVYDGLTNL